MPDLDSLHKRLLALQKQRSEFRIVGSGDLDIQGSFAHGFACNVASAAAEAAATVTPSDRCVGADCANQPTTMRITFAVTGTFPTSAECNSEVDYPLDPLGISGDSGVVDVTDLDEASDCSVYSVNTPDFSFESDCENFECNGPITVSAGSTVSCHPDDGHWILQLSIFANSPICNPHLDPWGGDPVLDEAGVDIGTDPTGTHSFSFDDPNYSTIHYEITVVIT